jgi:hypothetical protein
MSLWHSARIGTLDPPNAGKSESHSSMAWIWHLLYILYSLEVGVFLIVLPWLGIWDNNYIVYLYPQIQSIVGNPYLKGAVLGLGIVNIMIGIEEIVLLRKTPRVSVPK